MLVKVLENVVLICIVPALQGEQRGGTELSKGAVEVRDVLSTAIGIMAQEAGHRMRGLPVKLSVRKSIFTSYLLWTSNGTGGLRHTTTFHMFVLI